MAKLQACPKCGAQFDVSAMASGTKFTCGACGAVVSVGGGSVGSSGGASPTRSVPAPAASAGKRGPQYVPPDRQREAAAAARSDAPPVATRGGRAARAPRGGDGTRKQGLPPAALAGIGGGVLLAGLAAFLLMGQGKDEKKGADPKSGPVASNAIPKGATPAVPGGPTAVVPPGTAPASGSLAPVSLGNDTLATINTDFKRKANHSGDELK